MLIIHIFSLIKTRYLWNCIVYFIQVWSDLHKIKQCMTRCGYIYVRQSSLLFILSSQSRNAWYGKLSPGSHKHVRLAVAYLLINLSSFNIRQVFVAQCGGRTVEHVLKDFIHLICNMCPWREYKYLISLACMYSNKVIIRVSIVSPPLRQKHWT